MDITQKYKPSIVNGDYCVLLNSTQLRSRDFLAWLYNESPVKDEVVVDDRWGTDARCHHGGYWTCHDKFQPNYLPPHKWMDENTIGISWGLNRLETVKDYKTVDVLVEMLVSNVAYGGNLLLNVGPTSDGRIIPVMEERLLGMGEWLQVNGEAIYSTKPWRNQTENVTRGSYDILVNWSNIGTTDMPEPGQTTNTIKYLGKFESAQQCLNACSSSNFEAKFGRKCLSFTWHSNDCLQPQWSLTCYGRTDSSWTPAKKLGGTAGQVQGNTIYYTNSKEKATTVYAISIGMLSAGNFTLELPQSSSATQVSLLSSKGPQSLRWAKGEGNKGINIEVEDVDFSIFPAGSAYVFVLTNVN